MVGGGLLAWLVIIPTIAWLGQDWTTPFYPETEQLVRDMAPGRLWTRYVRYVGAGAVAMGGLITLIKSIPTIVESFQLGWQQIKRRVSGEEGDVPRTDRDLPLSYVLGGVGLVVLFLALVPHVLGFVETALLRIVAALLVAVFAFFFVTVSSRIVGLVGVTSNPTSGMTIATLLGASGIFLIFGWTDLQGQAAALTIGAVVAVAASIAGDTSQDLKTGFLLGATPRRQQAGELLGVLTSAFFVCLTVTILNEAYGFGTRELPAPQAILMKLVVEGVLARNLPWLLVGIGAAIALVAELLGLPSLAFAVGIYLPVATMTPVFIGGFLRWIMEKRAANAEEVKRASRARRALRLRSRWRRRTSRGRRRRLRGTHDARARGLWKLLGRRVRALCPSSTVRISRVAAVARGARAYVTHVRHDFHRISTHFVGVFHRKWRGDEKSSDHAGGKPAARGR